MNAFLKYVGYIAISLLVGYLSSSTIVEYDILYKLSNNIFQILITIFVAYGTLSNLVLVQLIAYWKETETNIKSVIKELERSLFFCVLIIVVDFIVFLLLGMAMNIDTPCKITIQQYRMITIDTLTFFSIFYYLFVVVDTLKSLYTMVKENCK